MTGLEDLLKQENQFKGRRGFIVCTGPSLSYKDLSFLKDEVTLGVNLSPLMFDQLGFQPSFNLVSDKFVYPNFKEVFERLTKGNETQKIVIASACETFPAELEDSNTYFVPKKHPQKIINFSENPVRDGFWRGKTVAYDALQFAYFLGFDEVYILGMDMSTNLSWGRNGHCYEIQRNEKFPNMVFPDGTTHEIQRGLPGHPEYRELIEQYMRKAKEHFDKSGRRVFNDLRSGLDVFEKIDVVRKFGYVPKIVAFVPAKGTSSRVKSKNMRILGDKPLFLHMLDTLLSCSNVDEVYLDTESDEVFSLATGRNHFELRRLAELASNKTNGNQLLLHEASRVPDADIYVQALPTAPFLSRKTIEKAIYELVRSRTNDSLFGVST